MTTPQTEQPHTNPDSEIDDVLTKFSVARDYPALMYEESKNEAKQSILALKHQWQLELREQLLSEVKGLELTDYDDTDPYQQGFMWAIGKVKSIILTNPDNKEELRNKLRKIIKKEL